TTGDVLQVSGRTEVVLDSPLISAFEGAERIWTLDIEQVNQQSLRLIRLALLGGFIAGLYWVWADLLSVFAYLNNFVLYEYTSGTGAAASMVPISLGDLLGALVIVG
ncbi:hypothetical protein, partial [Klebsiella pneumoniae]|uniref:hypothetical protein n=1 Tax=Klebsiella pneumoniae TaxID=573 RepID=UPI00193475B9